MGNKHRGVPRIYQRMNELILQGLPNLEVLARVRAEFPDDHPSAEQVRFQRGSVRRRHKDRYIPSSVEARRRQKGVRPIGD